MSLTGGGGRWQSGAVKIFPVLLNSDSASGGSETVQPAALGGDAPPAAALVMSGTVTEKESKLAELLAAEKASHASTAATIKAREITIAELEDKLRQARGERPPAAPKKSIMAAFLAGENES